MEKTMLEAERRMTVLFFPFTTAGAKVETLTFIKHMHDLKDPKIKVVWANFDHCAIGYGLYLEAIWGKDDIVILEHDLVPTLEMLNALIACKHPFICGQYYLIHPVSTHLEKSGACQYNYDRNLNPVSMEGKPDFCDATGFGFTKIPLRVQLKVPMTLGTWIALDSRFMTKAYKVLGANMVHIHYPEVKHLHGDLSV